MRCLEELLHLLKNTANEKHQLILNSSGMTVNNLLLCPWQLHMLKKIKRKTQQQQNCSTAELFSKTHPPSWRNNICKCPYLIISKLITHIYFEKTGWKSNLFSFLVHLTYYFCYWLSVSSYSNMAPWYFDLINAKNYLICLSPISLLTEGKISKLFQQQILGTDSFNTDFAPLNQNNTNLASVIEIYRKFTDYKVCNIS